MKATSSNVPYKDADVTKGTAITKSPLRESMAKGAGNASSSSRTTSQG